MGVGELYSIGCACAWAVAVVLFRTMGLNLPPINLNLFKNALAFLLLIPTLWLSGAPAWPELTNVQWVVVSASGAIGIAWADTLYLATLNRIGASRTAIIGSSYSPFVVLSAALLLGERLGPSQLFGFLFVMLGVTVASYRRGEAEVGSDALKGGIALGLFSIGLMAVAIVMVKPILEERSFFWVVEIRLGAALLAIIASIIVNRSTGKVIAGFRGFSQWPRLIAASFLGTYVAMLLWLAGYKYTTASIASILNETSSVMIVLLAWLFLGEGLDRRKVIGVILTFVGVVLVVAR